MLMLTMCKHLAELLDAEQPLFSITIEQLERGSGNVSADVRLTAEVIGKVHQKTRELGLDPSDTTGPELYLALIELVKKHDGFIAERLGAKDPTDVADVLPRLKALVEQIDVPKTCWVIKQSVAKRLLKTMPPKKVMKQLGYRSLDSMLKRESVCELFGGLRFVESSAWLEAFTERYQKLTPADFEMRQIEILHLDPKKWGKATEDFARQKRHNITHLKEMGVIIMLPMPVKHMQGISITVLPLLLHYINEIRVYSAFFKLQQVSPEFGEVLTDTLINDTGSHAVMAGQGVHWRILHRYFGGLHPSEHPEVFEPHLQPEDLYWRKAEDVLYRLEPALHFWRDMDFVATKRDGRLISFNLIDVAISYVNDLPYGQQAVYHFRDSLWNELYGRYMSQKSLEKQVLSQLNRDVLEPESNLLNFQEIS